MVRVAINGFGRIGKQFLLAALERKVKWQFIINESGAEIESIMYALRHDSVHPSLHDVTYVGNQIIVGSGVFGKRKIAVLHEADPQNLPWKAEKIDLVVDCSGFFTEREKAMKHLLAGARKVLISAPAKGADITLVVGVNDVMHKKEHVILSAGSCTTNCAAVMLKVLHDAFKVKNAFFVTTHAYTATQRLIDGYDKKDPLRGRAAALNIVPTTSGASQSVVEALPDLAGKIEGYALRVPVVDGSIVSLIAQVEQAPTPDVVNELFKQRANKDLKKVLEYAAQGLVSSDVIHTSASCIFDASFTSVIDDTISIAGWYDNEWGYSNRLVDVAQAILKK